MTNTSVTSTPACELHEGAWVIWAKAHNPGEQPVVAKVDHVTEPYHGDVMMVVELPDGRHAAHTVGKDHGFVAASDDEVASAKDRAARDGYANRLYELARLFEAHDGLPLPGSAQIVDVDQEDLARVADLLSLPIQHDRDRTHYVAWPAGTSWHTDAVITWTARYEDRPQPLADVYAQAVAAQKEALTAIRAAGSEQPYATLAKSHLRMHPDTVRAVLPQIAARVDSHNEQPGKLLGRVIVPDASVSEGDVVYGSGAL